MPLTLYCNKLSSPCKSVFLVANDLGVELVRKEMDLMGKQEHLTPEFIKLNPQHTIPTLDDNGFAIGESRAILGYLVNKYGKDDSLYPKDPQKRALVDSRLYFDNGALYRRFADVFYPIWMGTETTPNPEKLKLLKDNLDILNSFLGLTKWAAGDSITIADHSLAVSASNIFITDVVNVKDYPNIERWLDACKKTIKGYKEDNLDQLDVLVKMMEEKLKAQKK